MTPLLRKLLGLNWVLLLTMLALAIFGVVAIYSATMRATTRGAGVLAQTGELGCGWFYRFYRLS